VIKNTPIVGRILKGRAELHNELFRVLSISTEEYSEVLRTAIFVISDKNNAVWLLSHPGNPGCKCVEISSVLLKLIIYPIGLCTHMIEFLVVLPLLF